MQMFGKYRGLAMEVNDPEGRGRIRASLPALGLDTGWALPCIPGAGPGTGHLVLPPPGAAVWIEFEAGDVDSPIWSGGFWQVGEAPASVEGQPS